MRGLGTLAVGVIAFLGPASAASADVQLSIRNGRVSLVAKDATVQQILTEWARVGQTKIVNAERISGGPVTLQLTNVSEQQALDVLLRSVSGYLAAARATATGGASVFDRIVVLPTSVAPPASAVRTPSPVLSRPMPAGFGQPSERDDDGRRTPNGPGPNRGPIFSPFPQPHVILPRPATPAAPGGAPAQPLELPQAGPPATTPPAAAYPGAPTGSSSVGVAVPGTMVPQPQPGQPGAPAPQPTRPPGATFRPPRQS